MAAQDNLARKPIYIPATQPEEELSLRVAAYCRVSSDSDDQLNSFAAQQSHYYDFIHSHDHWELADIYADEGITGTAASNANQGICRNLRTKYLVFAEPRRSNLCLVDDIYSF